MTGGFKSGSFVGAPRLGLDFVTFALMTLLGLCAGFVGGLLGVGGGIVVVPILILAFGLQAQQAVGTSLVMIVFTALSATIAYSRQKRLDWKIAALGAVLTVPGAALGAYMTKLFSSTTLTIMFGVFLFIVAASMFRKTYVPTNREQAVKAKDPNKPQSGWVWKRKIIDAYGNVFQYDANILEGLALLFFGGMASGFFGIGGGVVVVPILVGIVGLPIHVAVATSMLTMIFTSLSGAGTHILLGHVLLEYAAPLVVGIVFGAQLGPRAAKRLRSASLQRVFAVVVFVFGILLIVTRL